MRHSIRFVPSFRSLLAAAGLAAALLAFSAPPASAQTNSTASSQASTPDGTINIQTASAEQLQMLPGIGPSRADAIVAQRERRAFRRIEDLMRVRGVGRATFRRLRGMLTVDGPTTMAAPAQSSRR
ncbi:MAG: ComEA family DNA-binding protein [Sandaracinaceae bacterium]